MNETRRTRPTTSLLRKLLRDRFSRPVTQKFGSLFFRYFPGQITCRKFEIFLVDYYEKRLNDAQRKRVERHMRWCPICRTSFAGYLKAIEMSKKAQPNHNNCASLADAPGGLIDEILAASSDHATGAHNG